ncbi:MAG: hypothetical protein IPP37_11590, partial [Saprospiraceae bacterium]|nr:hypothetical protein [Saprospiraceae bacterium]
LSFSVDAGQDATTLSGEKRRALFLVIKEILHNTVKYAGCHSVSIQIQTIPSLQITILENGGKGFDPTTASSLGNGLHNMHKRISGIGGTLQIQKTELGMYFVITA